MVRLQQSQKPLTAVAPIKHAQIGDLLQAATSDASIIAPPLKCTQYNPYPRFGLVL